MAMKAQTKRWVFAVSVAGSLLATLFYLDRSAPAVQYTQVQSSGQSLAARAPQPLAESVREPYIVQVRRAANQPPR
jgi:TorA maturation chaperone TorD